MGQRLSHGTCTGPLLAFVEDVEDEDESDSRPEDLADEPLEEGDQVWATRLFPELEYI